jgi:glycogen(starch) synthase
MRILVCSHVFAPSVGGVETVTGILAEQFGRLGATVTVVTQTPGDERFSADYRLVRRPSVQELCRLARRSDIVFQSGISLRTALPLLLCGRPIVVTHHGISTRTDGSLGWQDRLKRAVFPFCVNLAISNAVAVGLSVKSTVVGNPFEACEFTADEEASRDKDIVFLGRLVSDKGCDVALRALALLRNEGICPSFTVIGDGPEMATLKRLGAELGITDQVDFRGTVREERGRELARHKIMAVPSTWAEPFGIVALEGLASGCVLAASNTGGLPEAVGPCGLLFPSGDSETMAVALKRLLLNASLRETLLAARESHLDQFQPERVAQRYLDIFESVLKS